MVSVPQNFGHYPKLQGPTTPTPTPYLGWYGCQKFGRSELVWTPPLPKFGHFDTENLKVENQFLIGIGR